MRTETYVVLDRDEIDTMLPYRLVAETISGARWNTGKCKRLKREWFTEEEINQFSRLHKLARKWYLIKGVPDEAKLMPKTIMLFQKLGDFCAML